MIDINELRRLGEGQQWIGRWYDAGCETLMAERDGEHEEVAHPIPIGLVPYLIAVQPASILELLDRLEAAEKERNALRNEIACVKEVEFPRKAQAVADAWKGKCERLEAERDALRAAVRHEADCVEACKAEIAALRAKLEAAESDGLEQARLNGMGGEREAALLAKLEAAEKERDALRIELNEIRYGVAVAHDTIKALRAKIEAMERQEPVGKFIQHPSHGMWEQDGYGDNPDAKPLYALPGAQPAPSAPDGWLPVPEKHPTFDPVDLQLSDGSVLCGCVPQADGDYWWEGPSGEVFIDPKYASVTHWRLAADPKPEGE